MYILLVGLNHKTAPLELREKMAFSNKKIPVQLNKLYNMENIDACAIISTCNRTEIYAVSADKKKGFLDIEEFIKNECSLNDVEIKEHLYIKSFYEAVKHLFSVAAGLDSMVLGETQILGQVRESYEITLENKTSNGILNTLFQQAITVGKKVRTETLIDHNAVSISYVAVELAKNFFHELEEHKVLVIGAGEMSRLTAKHLVSNGVSTVMVSNRSFDKAVEFAREFGGEAVNFSELFNRMHEADIVISATGARHYVIRKNNILNIMKNRSSKNIFMIDIAVPRDIDPLVKDIPGVKLYDIDELQYVVDESLEKRKKAAFIAEKIIDTEVEEFFRWMSTLFVVPTIVALREKAEDIKENELKRAYNRLGTLTPREKKIISSMTNSIVKQFLHFPITNLKKFAVENQGYLYSEIVQNLYDLDIEKEEKKQGDELKKELYQEILEAIN